MTEQELRERLDDLTEGVRPPDLVERAWSEGRAERGRVARRTALLGLAAAMCLGLVAALGVLAPEQAPPASRGSGAEVSSGSATSSAGVGAVRHAVDDRVTVDVLPRSTELDRLPSYADRERVGLTDELVVPRGRSAVRLSEAGPVDRAVRAVVLRVEAPGRYRPVLLVPAVEEWVEVDTVTVRAPDAGGMHPDWPALGGDWIHPDRRQVAFPQPDGVSVVDIRDGSTRRVPIADRVIDVGWLGDGRLLATGTRHSWVVDGDRVEPAADARSSRPEVLTGRAGAGLTRESFAGDGTGVGSIPLTSMFDSTYGATVSNIEGWSAASVACAPGGCGALGVAQGVYAVHVDVRPRENALAVPTDDGTWKAGLIPLAWGPQDHLLVLSSSETGVRILAWDVIDGSVTRVATLTGATPPGEDPAPGELLPVIAL